MQATDWKKPTQLVKSNTKACSSIPTAPKHIRKRNPKTGNLPRIEICGYAISLQEIDTWVEEKKLFQSYNQRLDTFMIFEKLPDDFRCAIATPHDGGSVVKCVMIGSDKTMPELANAYNPACAKRVRDVIEKDLRPPQWYYLRDEF
ncbi:hypothetical protein CPB84DRAFT_1754370 [Gymnopilus junonius]|uniref:Uncharacterized protein n=1 Tax=Gymnopilus junonius TaxID=109634 RepID=A0A9P5N977_GYMJU|nr:hypothetical protein CPB84DRAFT_1754370 [Gymnopilus junonius]